MLNKFNAARHLSKAEKLFAQGDYDKARVKFDRAAEMAPDNPAVHLRYAVFLSETNDAISAVSHAARAVDVRPNSAPYRLFYGRILFDHGRLEDARTQFTEAVRLNPESQLARDYLALIEVAQGNIQSGLEAMASAGLSQNNGFHSRALMVLEKLVRFGVHKTEPKHLEVPEEDYSASGFMKDWRARGLLSDGIHLLDVSRLDEAVRKFRRAYALSPGLLEAKFQEGAAFFMAGDYPKAEQIMAELIDEGDEPALYLGASLAEQGKFEEAINVLEKIARPTPEYHYYLGLYLLSVGQDKEARHHFDQAVDKRYDLLGTIFERACELYGVKCKKTK